MGAGPSCSNALGRSVMLHLLPGAWQDSAVIWPDLIGSDVPLSLIPPPYPLCEGKLTLKGTPKQKKIGEGANMPEEVVEQSVGGDRCGKGSGLVITMNEPISSFLLSAANDPHLPHDLRELASDLSFQSSVPYRSIRAIWFSSLPSTRPPLRLIFSGSGFVFECPKPREKSKELKERLRKLSEMVERKAYQELVRDIMPKEPAEPFSSYKDQLGFGLHVLLVMFSGYLVGFTAFRALFNHSSIMNAAGGILGLVCGMLLETVLFIIRTSNRDIVSSSTATKVKKNQ